MLACIGAFLRREPLVHFTALAILLFAAHAIYSGDAPSLVRVDAATRAYVIGQKQALLARRLTLEEEAAEINGYIEDEILWREARRRGLDNNRWIRQQLVQNMRALLAAGAGSPSDPVLRAFFDQNPDQFQRPPTLDLNLLHFASLDNVPADPAAQLDRNAASVAVDQDRALGERFNRLSHRQLTTLIGSAAADTVFAIRDDAWHGPVLASRGAYLVRVLARHTPVPPSFADSRQWAEALWIMARQRELLDHAMTEIRGRYTIVVEPPARISAP